MNVAVIGGGIMGLTIAFRLGRAGHQVTVFEAKSQLGGLATWYDYGDFTWDKYYHVITSADAELTGLLEDLEVDSNLNWVDTKAGFLWRGRLISMSNYWEFLTFPALSMIQKVQLALGLVRCRLIRSAEKLDGLAAPEWLTSMFGAGVYAAVWEPLLECKFGPLKPRVPASLMWATIQRYQNTRSNSQGKERMGYLRGGGIRVMIEALADAIQADGGQIHCGVQIVGMDDTSGDRVRLHSDDGDHDFDRVISTLPSHLTKEVFPNSPSLHIQSDKPSEPLGVICATLILRKPCTPFYLTNPIDRGLPFTGIVELSNLIESEERSDKTVLMLPRYDIPSSPWFEKSDEAIIEEFLVALRGIWPGIESDIECTHVNRERVVQQLWVNGPPPEGRPGVTEDGRMWSVNNELAGLDTLNNNAVVRVANQSVEHMLSTEYWAKSAKPITPPLDRTG
jgi:protoporphyrinogen oxidase